MYESTTILSLYYATTIIGELTLIILNVMKSFRPYILCFHLLSVLKKFPPDRRVDTPKV